MYSLVLFRLSPIPSALIFCAAVLFLALSPGAGWAQPTPTPTPTATPTPISYDFGDAPDPPYATLLVNNGARHALGSGLYLGTSVDADADGQPSAAADGDDTDGNDDEDGVVFTSPIVNGIGGTIDVTASAAGHLDGWIDYNGDGDWNDPGEQVFIGTGVVAGVNNLVIAVPPVDTVPGLTYARFRLSSVGELLPDGPAPDGEVEDYQVEIVGADFGDAPDPGYPTLLSQNGARHALGSGLFLGGIVDADADGQPSDSAEGDDDDGTDDEDGITFLGLIISGFASTIQVSTSRTGYLDAWIDYNGDGDWNDPEEQILENRLMTSRIDDVTIQHPLVAELQARTYARFRFSSAGGLSPEGPAWDGEVEDYAVEVRGMDFGDAPDPPYPTLLVSNGARHIISGDLYLGTRVDHEPDGQPSPPTFGDTEDEDGVAVPGSGLIMPGGTFEFEVTASGVGYLNAWMDWNDDGDWADPGEQIATDIVTATGANIFGVDVPFVDVHDVGVAGLYSRFRINSEPGLSFDGLAVDGEVEDHRMHVYTLDWGDALDRDPGSPETDWPRYDTYREHDGARHRIVPGVHLGAEVDAESLPSPGYLADEDDLSGVDDEDGVEFSATIPAWRGDKVIQGELFAGAVATYRIVASTDGYLNAWLDWNANGVWEATQEEHIFADQPLVPGMNVFGREIPMSATHARPNYARFRFSQEGGIPHKGYVPSGEVEDYAIAVNQPVNITGWVYDDENWSGRKDPDELALSGATVSLSDATGTVATAIIEDGPYSFRAYELRQYYLQVTVPERYYMTTPDSAFFPATSFGTEITNNFGASNIYEIEGVVYEDTDANGSRDGGEAGIPGVGIVLRLGGDMQVGETVTDASGVFFFGLWNPGAYEVDEINPPGYFSTTPDTCPVDVVSSTVTYSVEFGEAPIPGDTNRDSQVNGGDLFYFSKYWHGPALDADSRCNPEDDATIDENDLHLLMREWK